MSTRSGCCYQQALPPCPQGRHIVSLECLLPLVLNHKSRTPPWLTCLSVPSLLCQSLSTAGRNGSCALFSRRGTRAPMQRNYVNPIAHIEKREGMASTPVPLDFWAFHHGDYFLLLVVLSLFTSRDGQLGELIGLKPPSCVNFPSKRGSS